MRLVLYGTKKDRADIESAVCTVPELCYRNIGIEDYSNYDLFIAKLDTSPPDCVVIAIDGADGMEGMIAARTVCRDVPVVWFSDDGGFGAQAYRLGCAYFHQKPLSPLIISEAISKCV